MPWTPRISRSSGSFPSAVPPAAPMCAPSSTRWSTCPPPAGAGHVGLGYATSEEWEHVAVQVDGPRSGRAGDRYEGRRDRSRCLRRCLRASFRELGRDGRRRVLVDAAIRPLTPASAWFDPRLQGGVTALRSDLGGGEGFPAPRKTGVTTPTVCANSASDVAAAVYVSVAVVRVIRRRMGSSRSGLIWSSRKWSGSPSPDDGGTRWMSGVSSGIAQRVYWRKNASSTETVHDRSHGSDVVDDAAPGASTSTSSRDGHRSPIDVSIRARPFMAWMILVPP